MSTVYQDGRLMLSGCLLIKSGKLLLLFRKDHHHYETPGGKVEVSECSRPKNPTITDLARTAQREVHEELGKNIHLGHLAYAGSVKFTIPDGRKAIAHKFYTTIAGKPKIRESIFSKMSYLPIDRLEQYPLSPDLRLFLPKIKTILLSKIIYQVKVIVRHQRKYLLLKKARDLHQENIGAWEVPGGKIKLTENPKKAALREIKEEIGLPCRLMKELPPLELEKNGVRTYTYIYVANLSQKIIKLSDEHSAYRWVSYQQINKLKHVVYKDLLKKYLRKAERVG